MSKNVINNLSTNLTQHQRELLTSQQNLGHLQNQLHTSSSTTQNVADQLNSSLSAQASLNNQLEVQNRTFSSLTCLFDKYRESKGIVLNPDIVLTNIVSAEELAHTDILKEACKSNYHEGFDTGLAKLTNLDFQDSEGKTILMHAIINGFYYGVDKLLQREADVNLIDRQGNNALLYCAQIPHIKYFKQIAEKTLDTNLAARSFSGSNALHLLLLNINKLVFTSELNGELADNLNKYSTLVVDEDHGLKAGHSGNITFSGSSTLTITGEVNHAYNVSRYASYEKALKLTSFLVEQKNININVQNDEGHTPLFLATKNLFPDVVGLLLNKYDALDLPNKNGYTAWDIAIYNSQQNLIDIFLPHKEAVNPEAVKLWCASRKGELDIVEQQINKGTDVNSTIGDVLNSTPLIQSIVSSHLPVISTLIKSGADINKADKSEASPLYYSLGYGGQPIQPTIVKYLIGNGADVNQPMDDGDTPLHMSCYRSCVGAIKLLLEHGAGIDTVNHQGKTPLHALIEGKTAPQEQKIISLKYLLCKSATSTLKDNTDMDAVEAARQNLPEALSWLEHPETLPSPQEFESSITGLVQDFTI